MTDFHKSFTNFNVFLTSDFAWQIVDNEMFSVWNMTDRELCESIVEDVLAVTMWEIQKNEQVYFSSNTLVRNLESHRAKAKVLNQIGNPEISKIFDILAGYRIRIKNDPAILQAAMDYCGVWYSGYNMPAGTIIHADDNVMDEKIAQYGSLENLAKAMSMELDITVPITTTVN